MHDKSQHTRGLPPTARQALANGRPTHTPTGEPGTEVPGCRGMHAARTQLHDKSQHTRGLPPTARRSDANGPPIAAKHTPPRASRVRKCPGAAAWTPPGHNCTTNRNAPVGSRPRLASAPPDPRQRIANGRQTHTHTHTLGRAGYGSARVPRYACRQDTIARRTETHPWAAAHGSPDPRPQRKKKTRRGGSDALSSQQALPAQSLKAASKARLDGVKSMFLQY